MESLPILVFCSDLMQKNQNEQEKQQKWLRKEMLNVVTNFTIVVTKFKASSRMNATTIETLLRQRLRRILKEVAETLLQRFTALS